MEERLRTLMIEDSEADAKSLLRYLQRSGYDVVHRRVETADAMRLALDEQEWDVVLSDYSMPDFTVAGALEILKERDLDIPFIIVSGMVGDETAAAAMRAGAHDFFLKERLARLPSAIARELGDAQARREKRLVTARLVQSDRQLREAVRARDEFLSIASHELKTPLTPLVLQLETALALVRQGHSPGSDPLFAKVEAKVEASLRNVGRMTGLINSLLDVTRITSGKLVIAPSAVDLGALVEDAVSTMVEVARHAGSELTLEVHGPVTGLWDRAGLETVVTNLLSNAIKFGDRKPIEVTLGSEGGTARLVVTDHGIGMAPDAQQRIFERFERAVSASHYGGLGIGLWITRQLVQAHGGAIGVSSVTGEGSTFDVTLPIAMEKAA